MGRKQEMTVFLSSEQKHLNYPMPLMSFLPFKCVKHGLRLRKATAPIDVHVKALTTKADGAVFRVDSGSSRTFPG